MKAGRAGEQSSVGVRILFVEDQESDVTLAAHHLRAYGIEHEALRVETEEALRAAIHQFRPTIILCDFTLPGFGGFSALEITRECAQEVPFIFLSGTLGEELAVESLQRGAIDYVMKSNLARLGPAVRRALAEAAARAAAKQQEMRIERLAGVLRMLSGINGAAVRIRGRMELLREACRLAVTVGGYASAIVALQDVQGQQMEPAAWDGADRDAAVRACEAIRERAARDIEAGRVSLQAPSVLILDEAEYLANRAGPGDRPLVALPLVVDTTLIGVIALCTRIPGAVSDEEMRMLREVAANLSFALQYLQHDDKVRLLSFFDVLTGLANRTLFCQRLGRRLTAPKTAGSRHAVAIVDIENLTAVNDSFGRHAGDRLLQLFADRLKGRFENTEWLAHFTGGTFAVVQSTIGPYERRVEMLNATIDALFAEPFELDAKEVPVAGRSGVALYPDDGRDPEVLVQKAEAALRTAKTSGERRGHYSARQHSVGLARSALERKLRLALERRQFELHYQPRVDVRTRRIEGLEALIRWNDPESGLVSPGAFLPILEASGMIVPVGEWVIERAAEDCLRWRARGLPSVRVAVNVSPVQLRDRNLVGCVLKAMEGWTTASAGLDVEITEGALSDEVLGDVRKLEHLRAAGVHVAIDDFGTGYSSLGRLKQLPVDVLKVDRSFVREMRSGAPGKKMVSIIISIARAFGMGVVAEGVEEQAELEALRDLGCDQSQGYLHSRPLPWAEMAELLARGREPFIVGPDGMRCAVAGSGTVVGSRLTRERSQ